MRKAFVEQEEYDAYWHDSLRRKRDWFSENCRDATIGLRKLGYNVKGFLPTELETLDLSKRTIVKGSIRTVRRALTLLGVPQPKNLDIPNELKEFAQRKVWATTLGEVRNAWKRDRKKVFIKPLNWQKAFCGVVYEQVADYYGSNILRDPYSVREWPDNFPVLAQEVVYFDGEWRAYILKKEILGVRGYGYNALDKERPKNSFVQEMVDKFKSQPAAYALDFGWIKSNGKLIPALVEVNEGFSLGNYGISRLNYAKMVEARWYDMVG
jgi:hypothetical protein